MQRKAINKEKNNYCKIFKQEKKKALSWRMKNLNKILKDKKNHQLIFHQKKYKLWKLEKKNLV